MRAIEHQDVRSFDQRTARWLLLREGENAYLLGQMISMLQRPPGTQGGERFFTVEENDQILAAAVLFGNGCLCVTWGTDEISDVLADFMMGARCVLTSVFGPSHTSWMLAKRWAELTGQTIEIERAERIYQMVRTPYEPASSGRLELATEGDRGYLREWVQAFIQEAEFELGGGNSADVALNELLREKVLYVWKQPEAVAMAGWLSPTPNGGCINFVYTPPEHRGNGHAKSVCSALARHKLSSGKKYCFIMTDNEDKRTNHLYQSIGARTLCELLRCKILSKKVSGLNVSAAGKVFSLP